MAYGLWFRLDHTPYAISHTHRPNGSALPDPEVTLLVVVALGLHALQDHQADLGPVGDDAARLQVADVGGLAVPVVHADVGVDVAADDGALDAPQFDGAGEVPEFVHGLHRGRGDGVQMHSLERPDPARDGGGVDLLLLDHLLRALEQQVIPVEHHQEGTRGRL